MTKSGKGNKLFALFLAISSVVIVAGIILYALLGFNTAPERPTNYTFEVKYNVVLGINDLEDDLQKLCEDTFQENGLSYSKKQVAAENSSSNLYETTDSILSYTFDSASSESLAKAVKAVNAAAAAYKTTDADGEEVYPYSDAAVFASWHVHTGMRIYEYAWRGAIAIAVAAIVALGYVCIRYGVSCGVAGLACCAHDALFTAALFAVTRFPVYAAAPLLYAAAAAFMSVLLWLVLCAKIKENGKAAVPLAGEECIRKAVAENRKLVLFTALPFAVAIAVLGLVAFGSATLFLLPMLVSVAVPIYSTLLLGPDICIPIRRAFDKRREAKLKKGGYVGKKKAAEAEAE